MLDFKIIDYKNSVEQDRQIEELLNKVYIEEGFTDILVAQKIFTILHLIEMGELILANSSEGELLGMIICACPGNLTKQIDSILEAEMRLLAVSPLARGMSIGKSLCLAFEKKALSLGCQQFVLSTQPMMNSAHRLYENLGYQRNVSRDWVSATNQFLVYEKSMEA